MSSLKVSWRLFLEFFGDRLTIFSFTNIHLMTEKKLNLMINQKFLKQIRMPAMKSLKSMNLRRKLMGKKKLLMFFKQFLINSPPTVTRHQPQLHRHPEKTVSLQNLSFIS